MLFINKLSNTIKYNEIMHHVILGGIFSKYHSTLDTQNYVAHYPDFWFFLLVTGGLACRRLLTAGAATDADHAIS